MLEKGQDVLHLVVADLVVMGEGLGELVSADVAGNGLAQESLTAQLLEQGAGGRGAQAQGLADGFGGAATGEGLEVGEDHLGLLGCDGGDEGFAGSEAVYVAVR